MMAGACRDDRTGAIVDQAARDCGVLFELAALARFIIMSTV